MSAIEAPEESKPVLTGPKRQHYLPRFYLQRFTGRDGCVAVFDRTKNEFRRQVPENTAVTGHLYTMTDDEGRQRFELETTLGRIEADASQALERLLSDGWCTDEDRFALSYFIATLAVRTPSFIDSIRHGNAQLLRQVLAHMCSNEESALAALRQLPDHEWESEDEIQRIARRLVDTAGGDDYEIEVDREHAVLTSLGLADDLAPIFMRRRWLLIEAPRKSSFVVPDNGISLTRLSSTPSWRGIGYGSANALTLLPLSPSTALALCGESSVISRRSVDTAQVRQINLQLASGLQRFLFARDDKLVKAIAKVGRLAERYWKPKFTVS